MRAALCYALGGAVHVLAAPTTPWKRQDKMQGWPELCDDVNLRGKEVWERKDALSDIETWFYVVASMNSAGGYMDWRDKQSSEQASMLNWAAQYGEANFDWKCDQNSCNIGNFGDECKEGESNAQLGLVLESASRLQVFLSSLSDAISELSKNIGQKIPSMFNTFGARKPEGQDWAKAIGMFTGSVGAYSALIGAIMPAWGGVAGAVSGAVGIAAAISQYLIPEEDKEAKFERFADASNSFALNVEKMIESIDKYVSGQMRNRVEGSSTTDIQSYLNDPYGFFNQIRTGVYAGANTPIVQKSDETVYASLSAPFVNAIWKDAGNYVIRFDGPAWGAEGFDLCGEGTKIFEDIQPGGKRCGPDGSLYMIAHWGKGGQDYKDNFRDVKGIQNLAEFKLTPQQIIDGSIANFQTGGFLAEVKIQGLVDRLQTVKDTNAMEIGTLNVWNLPYCSIPPSPFAGDRRDLEEFMAISALGCIDMKDMNGKSFQDVYGVTPQE